MRSLALLAILIHAVGALSLWPFENYHAVDGKVHNRPASRKARLNLFSREQIELVLAAQLSVEPVHINRISMDQLLSLQKHYDSTQTEGENILVLAIYDSSKSLSQSQQALLEMINLYCEDGEALSQCTVKLIDRKQDDLLQIQNRWMDRQSRGSINIIQLSDEGLTDESTLFKRALEQQQAASNLNSSTTSPKYSYCFASESVCKSTSSDCTSSNQGKCIFDGECWKCSCKPGYAGGFCQLSDKMSMFHTMFWVSVVMAAAIFGGISLLLTISSGTY